MVAIIDYGMGNLRSIQKAFEYLGFEAVLTDDPAVIGAAGHIVLPGVGAFADAVSQLHKTGVFETVRAEIRKGKNFLGVCLGMQLLFQSSTEGGHETEGLGIFPEKIVRFPDGVIVPHMGWNSIAGTDDILFKKGKNTEYVYFVHSFYCPDSPEIAPFAAARSEYGGSFCAAARRGNCIATQFHPEKSGEAGLRMLKRFGEMPVC